jgi:type III secretory pathway component EscT
MQKNLNEWERLLKQWDYIFQDCVEFISGFTVQILFSERVPVNLINGSH